MSRHASPITRVSAPSQSTRPDVGVSMPASMRMSVVLPAPFAPIRPQTPGVSVRLTESTAVFLPKRFVRFCSSIFISKPLFQTYSANFKV